jgi:hypothetical protein
VGDIGEGYKYPQRSFIPCFQNVICIVEVHLKVKIVEQNNLKMDSHFLLQPRIGTLLRIDRVLPRISPSFR